MPDGAQQEHDDMQLETDEQERRRAQDLGVRPSRTPEPSFFGLGINMGMETRGLGSSGEPTVDLKFGCCFQWLFACELDIAHGFYVAYVRTYIIGHCGVCL